MPSSYAARARSFLVGASLERQRRRSAAGNEQVATCQSAGTLPPKSLARTFMSSACERPPCASHAAGSQQQSSLLSLVVRSWPRPLTKHPCAHAQAFAAGAALGAVAFAVGGWGVGRGPLAGSATVAVGTIGGIDCSAVVAVAVAPSLGVGVGAREQALASTAIAKTGAVRVRNSSISMGAHGTARAGSCEASRPDESVRRAGLGDVVAETE